MMPRSTQAGPFHVLIKPSGASCNLDCGYCFYLPRAELYPGSTLRMPEAVLEQYLRQLLETQPGQEVTIAWQGGEPTLMGLGFFERAVEIVERYRLPGQHVSHTLQTNGTRIDASWAAFFKAHDFLIGLSLDGPEPLHDAYRVDKAGRGSFKRVMRGWEALNKYDVAVNILCALHAANAGQPETVYHFLRDGLGARYLQFIPIVERVEGGVSRRSVAPERYGAFLTSVFDEWVQRDVGAVFIQAFDSALGNWMGIYSLCVTAPTCGNALALEHNGDLYTCDHFVDLDYRLGNIMETHLAEMVASERQRAFGLQKSTRLPEECLQCPVGFACHGGCPKDRFARDSRGGRQLNYLCKGYKHFFQHIEPAMQQMASLLRSGRTPAEIMSGGS